MAAFSICVKIDAFAYMPVQDFGNAFSTFIAMNSGAKKTDRIKEYIEILKLYNINEHDINMIIIYYPSIFAINYDTLKEKLDL